MNQEYWRKCIVCKKEIKFSSKYFKCSVTSCDKKRSPAQFCSVDCWDVHRSIMSHKSAGADEYHSPTKEEWELLENNNSKVRMISSVKKSEITHSGNANTEDVLVVVSKLKNFVKESSGMNTSGDVMPALSDILRKVCSRAVENAQRDGRKTLMARDFEDS
ncbi:MAG: hypothetical protein ACJAS4_003602 [Bacteriovoracaceae bacterium]|jgi:hypothetical protein